jgi:hypothetical protein
MKNFLLKPGFEFIFSLSLIAILGLPPMLMAQNEKDVEIKIENGDTTVNGKNIKDLSAADRKNALRDIKHINSDYAPGTYSFKQSDSTGKGSHFMFSKRMQENGGRQQVLTENIVVKDSLGNVVEFKGNRRRPIRSPDGSPGKMELEGRFNGPMRFERTNSQNFDYVNTDNEGISTHLRFHVSDITNDDLKKMPYVEGGKFEITDFNLVPEFSTGKTLLMFKLPAKTVAEVKLVDSEGKTLWDDKAVGGSFNKSFAMGLNGVYYLQVKQGRNISLKKIMKEE